jgi:hypothetical protein
LTRLSVCMSAALLSGCLAGSPNASNQARISINRSFEALVDENSKTLPSDSDLENIAAESHAQFLKERAHEPYTLTYFEEAKARSALGWNRLVADDITGAAKEYQAATSILKEGDASYSNWFTNVMESVPSNAAMMSNLLAMTNAINDSRRPTSTFQAVLMNTQNQIAAYVSSDLSQTTAAAEILASRPPEVSIVRGQAVATDGIRMITVPSSGPLLNEGRLVAPGSFCTGSLVGYRLFLTAAHCVFNERAERRAPSEFSVRFDGIMRVDAAKVTGVYVSPAYHASAERTHSEAFFDNDWAILTLDRHPYRRGFFGVLPDTETHPALLGTPRANAFIAGYSGDLNDGRLLSLDWKCTLSVGPGRHQGLTNCVHAPGSSGAPVLLTGASYRHYYVVAVNAWGPGDGKAGLGGGPVASQFVETIARLRHEIGLPSGSYPDSGTALPASTDLHGFQGDPPGVCKLAGRWVGYWGIDRRVVKGNTLEQYFTGAEGDPRTSVSIDHLSTRDARSEAEVENSHNERDWDFHVVHGTVGYTTILSRVEADSCT